MVTYSKRKWLNHNDSPLTSSVVAYHGISQWTEDKDITFFEVSDCINKIRLHKTNIDSMSDFIKKLRILSTEANKFANWLENNQ